MSTEVCWLYAAGSSARSDGSAGAADAGGASVALAGSLRVAADNTISCVDAAARVAIAIGVVVGGTAREVIAELPAGDAVVAREAGATAP